MSRDKIYNKTSYLQEADLNTVTSSRQSIQKSNKLKALAYD